MHTKLADRGLVISPLFIYFNKYKHEEIVSKYIVFQMKIYICLQILYYVKALTKSLKIIVRTHE